MFIKAKIERLVELYTKFEETAQPYLEAAVCREGCADCCTNVGNVDITTLEGMIILQRLQTLPPAVQQQLQKGLKQNRKTKRQAKYARCAFLQENRHCRIYSARPFSCRRLYSLRRCGESGPVVHRQIWEAAQQIGLAIQNLDDTGYLGHMSYILQLLSDQQFRKTYLNGEFAPQAVRPFAMEHGIVINRLANRMSATRS